MNHKKTYILLVSEYFPKGHISEGNPTGFKSNIINGNKIHTIRKNFRWWKNRIDEINKGNAYLSLRTWSGKPYRSKQIEFAKFYNIGLEKIKFHLDKMPTISNNPYATSPIILAKNDGLMLSDFMSWFDNADPDKTYALIHFTDFKYVNN